MKYYTSERTAKAIMNGWPLCDVWLPINPQGKRTVEISIEITGDLKCINSRKGLSDTDDYNLFEVSGKEFLE